MKLSELLVNDTIEQIVLNAKLTNESSRGALAKSLADKKTVYDAMSSSVQKSEDGKRLKAQIDRLEKNLAKLNEAVGFKKYSATKEELDDEIKTAKEAKEMHKQNKNAAMAAKMDLRIKQAEEKKAKLTEEFEMKKYTPTTEELDDEIKTAKASRELYRGQGNAPMVAKMDLRIKQAEEKKAKLKK